MKSFFLICAPFALCICGGGWQLHGNTAMNAIATVQFSNGQTIAIADSSGPIGVHPGELVNITVEFVPAPVGQPVVVEALNGGSTSVGSSIPVVDANGTVSFAFLAPAKTGPKSIGIRLGSTTFRLQFLVLNASRP
jgi:hypothetical protein